MTMGPYGVHWDRGQTWWPMAAEYHRYISRCQFLLSAGRSVADILYLAPEGAPHVFRPPSSALEGTATLPDKKEYSFDGCSPAALISLAAARDGRIVFPGGASYRVLVLPQVETMTPELLAKIDSLARSGALIVGLPPKKSPSLMDYPSCDCRVRAGAESLWAVSRVLPVSWNGPSAEERSSGEERCPGPRRGSSIPATKGSRSSSTARAPGPISRRLRRVPLRPSLPAGARDLFRLQQDRPPGAGHLSFPGRNAAGRALGPRHGRDPAALGRRPGKGRIVSPPPPRRPSKLLHRVRQVETEAPSPGRSALSDFPELRAIAALEGPWTVSFDQKWGGPKSIVFNRLEDWSKRPEDGIRHYSGIAAYTKTFDLPHSSAPQTADEDRGARLFLDLGAVKNLARVKLNGKPLGVVWTAPWRVDITRP